MRGRLLVLIAAVVVLGCVAGAAVAVRVRRPVRPHRPGAAGRPRGPRGRGLAGPGQTRRMVFRSMVWGPHRDELASVPAGAPDGPRVASGVKCLRFYAAGGTGICLQAEPGAPEGGYRAVVLDSRLHQTRHVPLAGIPSRARVSPSGRMVAWTVFTDGDSYAEEEGGDAAGDGDGDRHGEGFATRTSILDTRTGALQSTPEDYAVIQDGRRVHPGGTAFWGVTFADDGHFYATLAVDRHTHLVRGDVAARTVTVLRSNVECPSLSPDGTRIAFKKRLPGLPSAAPWRLYVLDLHTLRDHPLAEPRSVDDQAVWSDDRTVAYALPGDFGADLYTVPADGTGAPHRLAASALAPAWIG